MTNWASRERIDAMTHEALKEDGKLVVTIDLHILTEALMSGLFKASNNEVISWNTAHNLRPYIDDAIQHALSAHRPTPHWPGNMEGQAMETRATMFGQNGKELLSIQIGTFGLANAAADAAKELIEKAEKDKRTKEIDDWTSVMIVITR